MPHILQSFEEILTDGRFPIVDQVIIPARVERRRELPKGLDRKVSRWLMKGVAGGGGLWNHQSLGIEAYLDGHDVAATTGTASGKSTIYQASGAHLLSTDPEAKIIAIYPIKALANDQMRGWHKAIMGAGLPDGILSQITSDMWSDERISTLERSRVVVMTPDLLHAWLLSNLDKKAIRQFVGRIDLAVLDEAHVLDSVFGTNAGMLIRRLDTARRMAGARLRREGTFKIIATSATLADPSDHLKKLTGRNFRIIDDSVDGSPRQERKILHIAPKESTIVDLMDDLVNKTDSGTFVTFVDSRMGAERLSIGHANSVVSVYRSGLKERERSSIENRLRSGSMRGVVSTSALEMGVDIPGMALGFNLGVPDTRSSLFQRIGRVGRNEPGVFAVLAEKDAFTKFGQTFSEYLQGGIERNSIYLDNQHIQFAHAACLRQELTAVGVRGSLAVPASVDWPEGFRKVFDLTSEHASVPSGFKAIANQRGKERPQYAYPLRTNMEKHFEIRVTGAKYPVTDMQLSTALREAYPGAIYLHYGRAYEMKRWTTSNTGEPIIKAIPASGRRKTSPDRRNIASVNMTRGGIVDGRIRLSGKNMIAECRMSVNQKVVGYTEGEEYKSYEEIAKRDPSVTPQPRMIQTTGIIIHLDDFVTDEVPRTMLAELLMDKLKRSGGASPNDLGVEVRDVIVKSGGISARLPNAIVIYDNVYGSLRLTERIYDMFDEFMDDLIRGHENTAFHGVLKSFAERFDGAEPVGIKEVRPFLLSALRAAPEYAVISPGKEAVYAGRKWTVTNIALMTYEEQAVAAAKIVNKKGIGRYIPIKLLDGQRDGLWDPLSNKITPAPVSAPDFAQRAPEQMPKEARHRVRPLPESRHDDDVVRNIPGGVQYEVMQIGDGAPATFAIRHGQTRRQAWEIHLSQELTPLLTEVLVNHDAGPEPDNDVENLNTYRNGTGRA